MKGNLYRKNWNLDRFGRKYYCTNARLGQLRYDKKQTRKVTRRKDKRYLKEAMDERDWDEAPKSAGNKAAGAVAEKNGGIGRSAS